MEADADLRGQLQVVARTSSKASEPYSCMRLGLEKLYDNLEQEKLSESAVGCLRSIDLSGVLKPQGLEDMHATRCNYRFTLVLCRDVRVFYSDSGLKERAG